MTYTVKSNQSRDSNVWRYRCETVCMKTASGVHEWFYGRAKFPNENVWPVVPLGYPKWSSPCTFFKTISCKCRSLITSASFIHSDKTFSYSRCPAMLRHCWLGDKRFVCLFVCLVFNGTFCTYRLYHATAVWSISHRAGVQHKHIMQLNRETIQ